MSVTTDKQALFKIKFFGISSKITVWVQLDKDTAPEDIIDAAISEATNDNLTLELSQFDTITIADSDKPDSEYEYSPDDE